MSELWTAILLGVIEGVTEFLPVSSTGHLLLAKRWLSSPAHLGPDFWNRFVVFIQIGAILAVVVYFRERILHLLTGKSVTERKSAPPNEIDSNESNSLRDRTEEESSSLSIGPESESHQIQLTDPVRTHPIVLIAVATIPVLVIGFLMHKIVEKYLETPRVIAAALIIGGVAMILIEKLRKPPRTDIVEDVTVGQAVFIGCVQVLAAIFPGTSRSAATILGGLVAGLSRPAAAEFSFFLAIPSMFAACGFSLLKMLQDGPGLTLQQSLLLAIGTLTSFLVAWVVIAAFMSYIRRYSFVPFAIYRIILGVIVLLVLRNSA